MRPNDIFADIIASSKVHVFVFSFNGCDGAIPTGITEGGLLGRPMVSSVDNKGESNM